MHIITANRSADYNESLMRMAEINSSRDAKIKRIEHIEFFFTNSYYLCEDNFSTVFGWQTVFQILRS